MELEQLTVLQKKVHHNEVMPVDSIPIPSTTNLMVTIAVGPPLTDQAGGVVLAYHRENQWMGRRGGEPVDEEEGRVGWKG